MRSACSLVQTVCGVRAHYRRLGQPVIIFARESSRPPCPLRDPIAWTRKRPSPDIRLSMVVGQAGLTAPHWRLTELGYMLDPPTRDFLSTDTRASPNHVTHRGDSTGYTGERLDRGRGYAPPVGPTDNVAACGVGGGRRIYGSGSQSTYGKPAQGNPPAQPTDTLSEFGPDYKGSRS